MIELKSLGFRQYKNFIDEDEEQDIVEVLKGLVPERSEGRSSVWRFGIFSEWKTHVVSKTIPDFFQTYCERIYVNRILPERVRSITVTHYEFGNYMLPRIDESKNEKILILSLLSDAHLLFERGAVRVRKLVRQRGLLELSKSVRHHWLCSIPEVLQPRYTISFKINK